MNAEVLLKADRPDAFRVAGTMQGSDEIMNTIVFSAVLLAALLHATWNGMVKKHSDKTVALAGIILGHIPFSIFAIISLVTSFGALAPGISTAPTTRSLSATALAMFSGLDIKVSTSVPKISSR